MKRSIRVGGWTCAAALLPATAFAAESSGNLWSRAWQQGPVVLVVTAVLALLFWAIFIHLASGITKLEHRSFGRAFRAAFISWILAFLIPFVVGLVLGLMKVESQAATTVAVAACLVLPGTLAIRNSYEAGFFISLITFVMALVVMLVAAFCAGLAMGVTGHAA